MPDAISLSESTGSRRAQRVAELQAALKDARAMRQIALAPARQRCRAERIAARARARQLLEHASYTQLYEEGTARLRGVGHPLQPVSIYCGRPGRWPARCLKI